VADGATSAIAALLVLGISNLGGGTVTMHVTGSLRRAWAIAAIRPHLVVGGMAAFLIAISFPALLALAYRLDPRGGGQTYSALEVVVSVGIVTGSVLVGRSRAIGSMRTAGAGLLLCGLCSLALTFSPTLMLVAMALFVASIGNPIYTVANQTALVEAADPSNRGSVMASRFSIVQAASIAGAAVGGIITHEAGPFAAYGVLAIGLILLGMFALAAGRRISNPLHGTAFEEATSRNPAPSSHDISSGADPALVAAAAQTQAK
jgi:MFS family permease